jgi:hypothetical protein
MLRTTRPGALPDSTATDEPHSEQKCRRTGLPLPPGLVNVFIVPVIASALFGTAKRAANALPVNL